MISTEPTSLTDASGNTQNQLVFPSELWLEIFAYLGDNSKRSLVNSMFLCRTLYGFGMPLLMRRLEPRLDLSEESTSREKLSESP